MIVDLATFANPACQSQVSSRRIFSLSLSLSLSSLFSLSLSPGKSKWTHSTHTNKIQNLSSVCRVLLHTSLLQVASFTTGSSTDGEQKDAGFRQ